jgi:hypothetical protein
VRWCACLVAVGIVAAAHTAVCVSDEHETDHDGADDEGEEAGDADTHGRGQRVDLGHALGGAHVDVDAAAKGEEHPDGGVVDLWGHGVGLGVCASVGYV